MFCTRGRVGSAKTPLLLTYDQFDLPVLDTRHPALPCSRFVLNRARLWSFKGDCGALIHFRSLGAYPGEPGFLRRRGAEGYFAWGCFSIFLLRAANEALVELAPLMSHFGKTNPMVTRDWHENRPRLFWQNEPKLFQQALYRSPTYRIL